MENAHTIGEAARLTGLTPKTIRFYEDEGLLPRPERSQSGYRLYGRGELDRLQLIRRARLLELDLPAIRTLVEHAFAPDCRPFGDELLKTLARQREAVDRRLAELEVLRDQLDAIERHVRHCCEGCEPTDTAAECGFCGLISHQEGGETNGPDR